jgi:nickel superoxide dismutase
MKSYRRYLPLVTLTFIAATFIVSPVVLSHCEIPCGIYGDPMRFDMMAEHITTIEKSMKQIHMLSEARDKDYNQLTRWVVNKGAHADKLSDIVTQYFLKQRVKPTAANEGSAYRKYVKQLTLLHRLMVDSMKCKQTTDLKYVENLRTCLKEFKAVYFGDMAHKHD